jgi:hypothetical protein
MKKSRFSDSQTIAVLKQAVRMSCPFIFSIATCLGQAPVTAKDAPQATTVQPRVNSLPCPAGTVALAAQALHFAENADFWEKGPHNDCQLDPAHPHQAVVALSYIHGEERSAMPQESFTGDPRDLDLVVWDLDNRRILAHRHDDRVIQDDADHLERLSIDIGAYSLAPDRRAFGIRTVNATHCTCDNSSNEALTLYLQDGQRIDRVLSFLPHSWEGNAAASEAAGTSCEISVESSTSLAIGRTSSHGLYDIVLTTTRKPQYDPEGTPATCPALKPETKILTLHFNGKNYNGPDSQTP